MPQMHGSLQLVMRRQLGIVDMFLFSSLSNMDDVQVDIALQWTSEAFSPSNQKS